MNLIIKNISKERSNEIINELDKLIDDGLVLDWSIDNSETQDYRNLDKKLGDSISISPYYRNNSLCFSLIGDAENSIKYANITKFSDLILNYFGEDIKIIKIINL